MTAQRQTLAAHDSPTADPIGPTEIAVATVGAQGFNHDTAQTHAGLCVEGGRRHLAVTTLVAACEGCQPSRCSGIQLTQRTAHSTQQTPLQRQ